MMAVILKQITLVTTLMSLIIMWLISNRMFHLTHVRRLMMCMKMWRVPPICITPFLVQAKQTLKPYVKNKLTMKRLRGGGPLPSVIKVVSILKMACCITWREFWASVFSVVLTQVKEDSGVRARS